MAQKDFLWKPLLVSVLSLFSLVVSVSAENTYLERNNHYTVRTGGNGVLHFYIPIWVYGAYNDYYLWCSDGANDNNDSYIWYSVDTKDPGRGNAKRVVSFRAERKGLNDKDGAIGEGYIRVHSTSGIVVLKSRYDGVDQQFEPNDQWSGKLQLKRKNDDDHKRITYLEFDWYPPADLDGKTFYVGASANIYRKYTGEPCTNCGGDNGHIHWFPMDGQFDGHNSLQSPELVQAYLYTANSEGTAGFGSAAIPYIVYQEPISYTTSMNSTPVTCTNQSGTLYVPTTDEVQHNFNATFTVWRDQNHSSSSNTEKLNTGPLDIPAYHRMYNLEAQELKDSQNSMTGNVMLSWDVHHPSDEDLVTGDFFEIQRALKPDYSDANSLAMVPYSEDSSTYHYKDDITTLKSDANSNQLKSLSKTYDFYDENSNRVASFKGTVTSTIVESGFPVYYRVRRASSSVWGWENHPYAQTVSLTKDAWLAPLARTQEEYTKDANYDDNRTIHFNLKIDNALVSARPTPAEQCQYDVELENIYYDMPLTVTSEITQFIGLEFGDLFINFKTRSEEDWRYSSPQAMQKNGNKYSYSVPDGATVQLYIERTTIPGQMSATEIAPIWDSFRMEAPTKGRYYIKDLEPGVQQATLEYEEDTHYVDSLTAVVIAKFQTDSLTTVKNDLYTSLFPDAQANTNDEVRCIWDKNAQLVVTKRIVDYGLEQIIYVPQDSIKRQEDGSWIAHFTDVADMACTEYEYFAQIDASRSVLNFNDQTYNEPIKINGPSLFTTSVANIHSLEATQGLNKQGVVVTWEPTAGSLSDYVLLRRESGANGDYDTLAITNEGGFHDTTAYPNKHYEYKLEVRYRCNNNSSSKEASVEGWRSPYGSIRGRVTYEDGSGCAGVNVDISIDDSTKVKTVITEADGSYFADSLLYDSGGTAYIVTPTTTGHGEFHYNNTTSGEATVGISMSRSEATNIDFVNTAAVRLTGRVLYKGTTIPVYGANFKLNGKLVSYAGSPVSTAHDGTFQMTVPKSDPITVQVVMDGHTFEGDGFLRIDDSDTIALDQPKDGVRFWDNTTVKLAGRIVGGNDQGNKPLGFGLSKNNIGDDLKMIFELEGDNVSYMVHDLHDPTLEERDTVFYHLVKTPNGIDTVGTTMMHLTQKRLIVYPDVTTGEYEIDLWPVRYKIPQITAKGYATLYAAGEGAATIDLTAAVSANGDIINDADTTFYQSVFSQIYHAPIELKLTQRGLAGDCDYYGLKEMMMTNVVGEQTSTKIPIIGKDEDSIHTTYLFQYPVYSKGNYNYRAEAYEEYFYNNDKQTGARDKVSMHGGILRVHNGLHNNDVTTIKQLDKDGRAEFTIVVEEKDANFRIGGEAALRTVSVSAEIEEAFIEAEPIRAFVAGEQMISNSLRMDSVGFTITDILRDPPGEGSYTWLETGAKYNYSHAIDLAVKAGLSIGVGFGSSMTNNIGTWTGEGLGVYTGTQYNVSKQFQMDIPLVLEYKGKWTWSYDIQTTERITTSSDNLIVGSDADVFVGSMLGLISGEQKAIRVINEQTYQLRKPAVDNGSLIVLAEGADEKGKYYLVIGTETILGSTLSGSFAYTQHYIVNTLIPNLIRERDMLLLDGDSATIQALADQTGEVLYMRRPNWSDSVGVVRAYSPIRPKNYSGSAVDKVNTLNQIIVHWLDVLVSNEKQKVEARSRGRKIGTWSVSGGTTKSHTETYTYSHTYDWELGGLLNGLTTSELFKGMKWVTDEISNSIEDLLEGFEDQDNQQYTLPWQINGTAPAANWKVTFTPIIDFALTGPYGNQDSHSKSMGFTLAPSNFGSITTSVYNTVDSAFMDSCKTYHYMASAPDKDKNYYGSFVFFTEAGATMCPHEDVEYTQYYSKGTLLNNGTLKIEEPRLEIDAHERSDVPADMPAIFNLRISNEGQVETGLGAIGTTLSLTQTASTNPNGAKIFIDGMPVTGNGMDFFLASGESVNKVMEVYRGTTDDYEDIELRLGSTTCATNADYLKFSVHFLPSSSDVEISSPHDKWIMNTFSSQDSVGYYLPITIEGFDVHHRGFDHIEFQYKLSTQSDDDWVNQCSFYADKDLYDAATGNKQMITNGRINTLRFYGERDPMEQQYDLRAVSFCRHGSGFVSKSSKILTGTKDTRPPRVFGNPTPANSVLTVNDILSLRFNEAIAGNYLDEDNNFQIVGETNATGIVSSTSVNFDGGQESYAASKVARNFTNRSFTIDVTIKPSVRGEKQVLFEHGTDGKGFIFGITAENKLFASVGDKTVYSKQLDPILSFSRVMASYDTVRHEVHLYSGTQEITDGNNTLPAYSKTGTLVFGRGYKGNMLEARVWSKALLPQEIVQTNMCRLTGYERELTAYYPMNEGKGEILEDKANGATLYMHGAGWILPNGISLHFNEGDAVELDQDKFARSSTQDFSLMFWFKTSANAPILRAGFTKDGTSYSGTCIGVANGNLVFRHGDFVQTAYGSFNDDDWHQYVLMVNRTYNIGSIFVDGKLTNSFAASKIGAFAGQTLLGGQTEEGTFVGNIDEIVLFEQALPSGMISHFYKTASAGDEMGIIALLSFQEEYEDESGVIELRFSPNDQRVFKDSEGNILNKIVPLIVESDKAKAATMADKKIYAPVQERGLLTKMNFDWAFNHDQLVINLNMVDREINKQTIRLTVRNVEDLNGNRMESPAMWTAFVDRNQLKWDERYKRITLKYESDEDYILPLTFKNIGGNTHQYEIQSLTSWMTVDQPEGTVAPLDEKQVLLTIKPTLPVGTYSDMIYLTDENDLAEPLCIELTVEATPPYEEVDENKYTLNMSLCGKVQIVTQEGTAYDTDERDIVYALYRNECVGMANVMLNPVSNATEVFLTVHGDEAMNKQPIRFQLWQASTGKIYDLNADRSILFAHGYVYGCGAAEPVMLTASGSERQQITLKSGWNWISTNLDLTATKGELTSCMSAAQPWTNGDLIKNPNVRQFSVYDEEQDVFSGSLSNLHFSQMYMVYSANGNTMRVSGEKLPDDSMRISVRGDGQWSPMPCILDQRTSITDAFADYYQNASAGDIIKAHNRFAAFSSDGHWVGDLQTIQPGEGYIFRRMAAGAVDIMFYRQSARTTAPKRAPLGAAINTFTNPNAATNMTMIARVVESKELKVGRLEVYVNDELVGVATPLIVNDETLYFVTVQNDKAGELRFEADGQPLEPAQPIIYQADAHAGSLKSPVLLRPADDARPYKILEDNHVFIIRNGERYDVTGKKVQ